MRDKFLYFAYFLTIFSVVLTSTVLFFVFSADFQDIYEKVLPVTLTILVIITVIYFGTIKYLRIAASKLFEKNGKFIEDEGTEKIESLLEERERLRREMYSNISHEMKTPLTTIRGYAEMMENRMVPPEDIPDIAAKMNEESCHLLSMINRVMKSVQHPEDSPSLLAETFDMKCAAVDVAERLRPRAEKKHVALIVDGESVMLFSDRDIFEQICYNLVDNAVKYSKEGGTVRILTEKTSIGKRLLVADNGIGISEEDQKRIFERFFRADRSHSRKVEGTGLGLSIVKHHVDMLGADLVLNSNLGKGTEISVLFN